MPCMHVNLWAIFWFSLWYLRISVLYEESMQVWLTDLYYIALWWLWVPWAGSLWHKSAGVATVWATHFITIWNIKSCVEHLRYCFPSWWKSQGYHAERNDNQSYCFIDYHSGSAGGTGVLSDYWGRTWSGNGLWSLIICWCSSYHHPRITWEISFHEKQCLQICTIK